MCHKQRKELLKTKHRRFSNPFTSRFGTEPALFQLLLPITKKENLLKSYKMEVTESWDLIKSKVYCSHAGPYEPVRGYACTGVFPLPWKIPTTFPHLSVSRVFGDGKWECHACLGKFGIDLPYRICKARQVWAFLTEFVWNGGRTVCVLSSPLGAQKNLTPLQRKWTCHLQNRQCVCLYLLHTCVSM